MSSSRQTRPPHPLDPGAPRYGYRPADPAAPPAVSVVTPVYNAGAPLLEAADSLARQSLQQWEWVIVDDGSDDPATLAALAALAGGDPRVRVEHTPNRGVSAARNLGARLARAELIFFLDSDNLLAPTALEKLAWHLAGRPGAAFAGGWSVVFGAEHILSPRGFGSRAIFPYDNSASSQSMLRAAAFARAGGFDEARRQGMEDWDFWARAAGLGLWGSDVPEYLVWDRRKPPEAYRSYRWEYRERAAAVGELRAAMRARDPQLFRDGPPRPPDPRADQHPRVPEAPPFANALAPAGAGRRVLMLLPSLNPGGADRFALDLAAGLVAGGDRVTVCLTRDMPQAWAPELARVTPDVFDLPAFLAPADAPRFLSYLVASRQVTHVLVSNSLLGYQLLPFLRGRHPRAAYLDVVHAEQEQRHGGFVRVLADHDELVDLHVVTYGHLRELAAGMGADRARTEVCYIGADPARWAPDPGLRARVRGELGVPADEAVVLFAARLSAEKRPRLAAEVLLRLRDGGARFTALVAGDGEDRRALEAFVRLRGLRGRVRVLGGVPHARVRELMAAADLFLLPSQREGIALTLYEAMAMGVVPVAADVGGQAELVTPECGVLVPHGPDEAEAYAAALRRLIDDPALRARMAAAGRARVQAEFDLRAMPERMRRLLDRAAALAREAPRPAVGRGAGLASATLAVEHDQLEERLRRLLPVRLALRLRWSSAGRLLRRAAGLRAIPEALDRRIYVLRREAGQALRRARAALRGGAG